MTEPPAKDVEPDDEDAEWDEDDDDDDIDAEAEKMAQRLRAELLADIHRVNAAAAATPTVVPQPIPVPAPAPLAPPPIQSASSKKEQDIIATMKSILTFLDSDALARTTLESSIIPNMGGASVFNVITSSVSSGRVPKEIAMPLHQSVVDLARTNSLFGNLRLSNASSIQLDKGKRKREHDEHVMSSPKRTYAQHYDLNAQLMEAVGGVSHALAASSVHPLESDLISPIQLQLHQIFLFAVTSSPRAGIGMNALQEIGGLIRSLASLRVSRSASLSPNPAHRHSRVSMPHQRLPKTFSRLYSLRNHQRVHAVERPYRCTSCPASFVRNHDLRRHVKLHDNKAWKCSGCDKIFSRRDAIKRHKKVENDDDGDNMREEKRAKMWNGIAVSVATGGVGDIEEGEIQPSMLSALQTTVLTLHPLLQTRVSNALRQLGLLRQRMPPKLNPHWRVSSRALRSTASRTLLRRKKFERCSRRSCSNTARVFIDSRRCRAALAAQAQAEAEAALEEEEEDDFEDDAEYDEDDGEEMESVRIPGVVGGAA
ncbi:hypothetical protein CPB85DRAFT_1432786 [Mucidula mucida]|nr:hypothetical protein CPB85DRAFT_1432786 [Mucidula mucida]